MTSVPPPGKPSLSLGSFAVLVLWFGLLAGIGELLVLGWDKFASGKLVFTTRHVVWMTPLADVIYVAAIAIPARLVSRGRLTLQATIMICGTVTIASWLFMLPILHPLANLVLAVGGALQLSRVMARRGPAFTRFAQRTTKWLLAVVLVATGAVPGWAWWQQGRTPPPGAPAGAPNVILVTLDTVRAKSLGLYGYEKRNTPHLEQWANSGTVFDNAIATAPWTLPSHASIFTGRFPHELSANWASALDDTFPTLAERLAGNGYTCAGFVSNLNYCSYEVGLDRGFHHYEDFPLSLGQLILCSSLGRAVTNSATLRGFLDWHENLNRKNAAQLRGDFLSWLDAHPKKRPFFAFLNFYDAHQPYLPPPEYCTAFDELPRTGFRYDTNLIEIDDWNLLDPAQIQAEQDSYDAAIHYLDDQLGLLYQQLADRDLLANSLVIITADHGEQFGEHGLYNHGNSLYLPSLRVPLLVSFPGRVPEGIRVAQWVGMRDLPSTILDLVGASKGDPLAGSSLARYWQDGESAADALVSEVLVTEGTKRRGEMKSLLVDHYHYIRNGDDSEEFYDVKDDPDELIDLRGTASGKAAAATYRRALNGLLSRTRQ